MVKPILPALGIIFLLSSCTAFKSLHITGNKPATPVATAPTAAKFIDEITVTPVSNTSNDRVEMKSGSGPQAVLSARSMSVEETNSREDLKSQQGYVTDPRIGVEAASPVQLKYSILMNTEVESLPSKTLLETVDNWYGVRYHTGGNTKSGIDCSGFTVAVYSAVYGLALPRVAKEQYRISRKISTTELQEGDLVFFNTTGRGISHVGLYLGNNHFIHATVSKGVMVNSLFEPYYLKRFVGAGRIENKQIIAGN